MTTAQWMLSAPAEELTIGKVRDLLQQCGGQESQAVEFKKTMAQSIARSVAAMANSYGGLILIGVDDQGVVDGVKGSTADAVSSHCYAKTEPPWVPEIVKVSLDDGSGRFILVLRIDPRRCIRRPLFVDGVAYVRYNSTTRQASWMEMRELFAETTNAIHDESWPIEQPKVRGMASNSEPNDSVVVRTGLAVPVVGAARWRPLSEATVTALGEALDASRLGDLVGRLTVGQGWPARVQAFNREGVNRGRHAELCRWGAPCEWPENISHPVEAQFILELPGSYGLTTTHLKVTIDIVLRSGINKGPEYFPWRSAKMSALDLAFMFDALLAALTDRSIVGLLAELAAIDTALVPQPREMHLVSSGRLERLFDKDGLTRVTDRGAWRSASMAADPALDLADQSVRWEIARAWLIQAAMDAGLAGMEAVAATLRFPGQI